MAEIRKHNPDAGDGLGKLVRDAMGERIRPTEPGQRHDDDERQSPPEEADTEDLQAASLPLWPSSDGPTFTF